MLPKNFWDTTNCFSIRHFGIHSPQRFLNFFMIKSENRALWKKYQEILILTKKDRILKYGILKNALLVWCEGGGQIQGLRCEGTAWWQADGSDCCRHLKPTGPISIMPASLTLLFLFHMPAFHYPQACPQSRQSANFVLQSQFRRGDITVHCGTLYGYICAL